MLKFNVKRLILAFCILGGMVTAGVASAIPERYIIRGDASGEMISSGEFHPFQNNPFRLQMDIDSDALADPLTFIAYLEIAQIGGAQFQYNGVTEPFPFEFNVSRYIDSNGGRLIANAMSPGETSSSFWLDAAFQQDGSVVPDSRPAFSFGWARGYTTPDEMPEYFVYGGGDIYSVAHNAVGQINDDSVYDGDTSCMILCNSSPPSVVALPTPSSALLMFPLLLFVFRRSLLDRFRALKPLRIAA